MNSAEMRRKAREQENRTCKTCKDNDNGLCDRKGILVEDDYSCRKWQPDWKERFMIRFLRTK